MGKEKELSAVERDRLTAVLQARFKENKNRHHGIEWEKVEARLVTFPEKLWSLNEMEKTGGEPDVIGYDRQTGEYLFADCAAESPAGRRSLCYDREARESRKEFKPVNSAVEMAEYMGIDILTEQQYRELQLLGNFDKKTSSWLKTPDAIRKHGGAIFGDFRYNHVFIYHNGVQSYYAARGFRGMLRV